MLYIIYYITYYIFLSMCLNGSLIWKGLSKKHYKIPNASQQITSHQNYLIIFHNSKSIKTQNL